ncbi:hypothetical protein PM082_005987 [Marasmius tenuissimus]|nr:hypothetical protein PM082_005987 [Marasmius tenuissimus]
MDTAVIERPSIAQVSGNASDHTKAYIAGILSYFSSTSERRRSFADYILPRMTINEISILSNLEEPTRKEARVVCTLMVESDMINGMGNLHGGCSAYLVDICSGFSLSAYIVETTGKSAMHVSQAINTVYHSPAALGDKLRIVNTTVSVGKRALTARTEIWNETHHRLVVSGTQIAMFPSLPKSNL